MLLFRRSALTGATIAYLGADNIKAATNIDGQGLWVVPGLWDMHVHISDESFFPLFLQHGVLGVRDMGGGVVVATDGCESIDIGTLQKWREEIESGKRQGPDLVIAGPVASASGWPTSLAARTPAEARKAVDKISALGADFVKVYEDIPLDAFVALADQATQKGLPIAGHVSEETLTILDAIEHNQRSIEHVRSHFMLCFAKDDEELEEFYESDDWDADDRLWGKRHRGLCPEIWSRLRNEDVWITPTLAVQNNMIDAEQPDVVNDPLRRTLPQSIQDAVGAYSQRLRLRSDEEREEVRNWNEYLTPFVQRAKDQGASILAGSDAACEGIIPGKGLHQELSHLVEAGLDPLEALQTATLEPAAYFEKADQLGQIDLGFKADLLLLNANPLTDIAALNDIALIIRDGAVLTP